MIPQVFQGGEQMRNIRLLIADHNEGFANDVASFLGRMPGIDIAGFRKSGDETVNFINENAPDAVLLELILDGLDGISVLKTFTGRPRAPAFIVCTEFGNEVCIRRAHQYGACCFLCKPVSRQALYDAIVESVNVMGRALMSDESAKPEPPRGANVAIKAFLAASGIPRQSFGYRYLCDAAAIARQNPASLSAITKLLYPEIARINASTPARVERDIRTAIYYAYQHFNLQVNGSRPTNREFIQLMTDQAHDQPNSI
jgi:two-component system response regulator (stage 0 sporulation protein A)